jgi:hypothetical protein
VPQTAQSDWCNRIGQCEVLPDLPVDNESDISTPTDGQTRHEKTIKMLYQYRVTHIRATCFAHLVHSPNFTGICQDIAIFMKTNYFELNVYCNVAQVILKYFDIT